MADAGSSGSTSDESLDASSDKFDPLKALYSSKLPPKLPSAPIYDNISKFEAVLSGKSTKKPSQRCIESSKPEGSSKQRFLPHQGPSSRGKQRPTWTVEGKNVLSKMQKTLGPLGMLHEYMESRTRVKVYTRNAHGIRGHVEAYVAAFDKHWNLALEDCFEVWTRKLNRKAPALGIPIAVQRSQAKTLVGRIEGKKETLERHVPQMLLRGEQVAIIVKFD